MSRILIIEDEAAIRRVLKKIISEENIGKEITYAVDGNYSGKTKLVFREPDGSRTNIEIAELPWSYTFTTTEKSAEISLYGMGTGGIENETLSYGIQIDGDPVKTQSAITGEEGEVGLFPEMYISFD